MNHVQLKKFQFEVIFFPFSGDDRKLVSVSFFSMAWIFLHCLNEITRAGVAARHVLGFQYEFIQTFFFIIVLIHTLLHSY